MSKRVHHKIETIGAMQPGDFKNELGKKLDELEDEGFEVRVQSFMEGGGVFYGAVLIGSKRNNQ